MSQASVVTCRPYLAFASTVQRRARTKPPAAPPHTRTPKKNQNEPTSNYLPRVTTYVYMEQVLKHYWVVSFAAIDPPAVLLVPTTYLLPSLLFAS